MEGSTGQRRADARHVERFGRWAASYDSSPLQHLVFAPIQEAVVERAAVARPLPGAVLDIGCGTGQLLGRLAERFPGARLAGADPAAQMIAAARASWRGDEAVAFVEAYAEHLPFPDAAFDLATTTMSFHHWADQPAALREVARVLAPGGVFLLADALPTGWLRWVFARNRHGAFNTPRRLAEMMVEAGFPRGSLHPVAGFGGTVQVVEAHVAPGDGSPG